MFLCVAFAFIKACALLSAAYLTCAEEDLHLYGLLLQHTRAYKCLLMVIGLIYTSLSFMKSTVSFYYATNTDTHSHAGLYILFLHCLRVISPDESACVSLL